ncbi:uncharacterized protein LOC136040231 [Artemia franciscana]|uniref:MACPF domain-containing protein n=1 Tax=Artemia franciscana TaxID=6661 RepID=A0AA88L751_ARTSF|nr:hypothetical protein QYM36_010152 [Artemia franciscana]
MPERTEGSPCHPGDNTSPLQVVSKLIADIENGTLKKPAVIYSDQMVEILPVETDTMLRKDGTKRIEAKKKKEKPFEGGKSNRKFWLLTTFLLTGAVILGTLCTILFVFRPVVFQEQAMKIQDDMIPNTTLSSRSTYNFCPNGERIPMFPSLEILSLSYDLTRANPLLGSQDPGFGRPIFDTRRTVDFMPSKDCQFVVPPGFIIENAISKCGPDVSSFTVSSIEQYENFLSNSVHVTRENEIFSAKFKTSEDYGEVQGDITQGRLLAFTEQRCITYTTQTEFPPMNELFLNKLRMLERGDDEDLIEFFEYYGTHYISSAVLGTKQSYKFTLKNETGEYLMSKIEASLSEQATTAGLYHLARANLSVYLSTPSEEMAEEFLQAVNSVAYPHSILNGPKWIEQAFTKPGLVEMQVTPIEDLVPKIPGLNTAAILKKLKRGYALLCSRLTSEGFTATCGAIQEDEDDLVHDPPFNDSYGITLPSIALGQDSLSVKASWARCLALCRADRHCYAATSCRYSTRRKVCDTDSCWLHRKSVFYPLYNVASALATYVPNRQDIGPLVLNGLELTGKPLEEPRNVPTEENCLKNCLETKNCAVVSVIQLTQKPLFMCRMFNSGSVFGQKILPEAKTVFLNSVLSTCILSSAECTDNAECKSNMCQCKKGFKRIGLECFSALEPKKNSLLRGNEILKHFKKEHAKATTTTTETPHSAEDYSDETYDKISLKKKHLDIPSKVTTEVPVTEPENEEFGAPAYPWQFGPRLSSKLAGRFSNKLKKKI